MHPMVQVLFPISDAIFQEDNSPIHTARNIQSWFEEHEDALQHLWLVQSSSLNIIKPLVSFREKQIPSIINQATRRRVVQYSTRDYSELTRVYSKKDKSCYRQMVAKLHIDKEMCIFHSCFHYFCPFPVHAAKLTLRRLMSYIYMEHPFLMFLDHTQRRSTVGRTPLDE